MFETVNRGMAAKRHLFRFVIDRTAEVHRGETTIPCQLVDLTEKGVRLRVEGTFGIGEELHLQFPLTEGELFTCVIRVTYGQPPHLGAVIVRTTPEQQKRLSDFIEQVSALNMPGF